MYGKNDNLEPKGGKTQNFKMEIKFSFCLQFCFLFHLSICHSAQTQISTAYNVFDKLPDGRSKKQQFIAKRLILKNLRNATDNPPAKTIKLTDGLRISFFIASLLRTTY